MNDIKRTDLLDGHTLPAANVMHGMAFQGKRYEVKDQPIEERYDFVIAGAGISGLAAAHFYQKKFGPNKKILIVDPLHHFGGHASRNEFVLDGIKIVGYGGSESFQSPKLNFSDEVKGLMKSLNVEISKFENEYFNHSVYPDLGLSRGTFFGAELFGKDTLVSGDPTAWISDDVAPDSLNAKSYEDFFAGFPISEESKQQLIDLYTMKKVTLERFATPHERAEFLKTISYEKFLREEWKLNQDAINYFAQKSCDFFGLTPNQVPALDACHYGFPGSQGIKITEDEYNSELGPLDEPYVYHFPDGNASLARLLVRSLIPSISDGNTMEDVVLKDFKTQELDSDKNAVRIRLNHTVVSVENRADGFVDIGLINNTDGSLYRIETKHCTLACFNMVIPYIFKDLKEDQVQALKLNIKVPMVYSNVLIKNWHAWVKLGVHEIYGVNTFHSRIKLDYSLTMGGYSSSKNPAGPMVIHMVHVATVPSETDPRVALRNARKTFFALKFEDFEKHIKNDLNRMLGPGGFNAQTDIQAITVNRWSHGYSYSANTLIETEKESQRLMNLAKMPIGNVTIANSDAGWNAYAHCAIDEAYRAIQELG